MPRLSNRKILLAELRAIGHETRRQRKRLKEEYERKVTTPPEASVLDPQPSLSLTLPASLTTPPTTLTTPPDTNASLTTPPATLTNIGPSSSTPSTEEKPQISLKTETFEEEFAEYDQISTENEYVTLSKDRLKQIIAYRCYCGDDSISVECTADGFDNTITLTCEVCGMKKKFQAR